MRDCRYCSEWEVCPCGKKGHDNGSSIGYSAGECTDYRPRVLALDEIKTGEPYWFQRMHMLEARPVICIYRENDTPKPYATFVWQFGTFLWESEDYNKFWRCWTAKPTNEQMEAVEWDD